MNETVSIIFSLDPLSAEVKRKQGNAAIYHIVHSTREQICDDTRRFWLDISCSHHSMRHCIAAHGRRGLPVTAAGDVGMRRTAGASEQFDT